MPTVVLLLIDNRQMIFTSSDYFVYPTRIPDTAPVKSKFGIAAQYFNKDANDKQDNDEFLFGQLLV
jgi:hypothetical protein